jgi:hypothetical protein
MAVKFDPDMFKMGYFIVYKGDNSLLARQIWLEQMEEGHNEDNARYSHVECSGGEFDSVSVNFPKAKLIDIRKIHGGSYVKLVKFNAPDYDIKRYKVAYFSMSDIGKTYAWWSLLWWTVKDWAIFRKFLKKRLLPAGIFCSFSCAKALDAEYMMYKEPSYYMPADFLDEKYFTVVWEGEIPKYENTITRIYQRFSTWKNAIRGKAIFGVA